MKKLKRTIQRILSIPLVRASRRQVAKAVAAVASASYFLSVPYHWFAFGNFMREQRSVQAGKKQYYKNLAKSPRSNALLRRNTHRLEKGLIMQPRRPTFAENYIDETVQIYVATANKFNQDPDSVDQSELEWANNVLNSYFEVVEATPRIAAAQQSFESCKFLPENTDLVPYTRDLSVPLPTYEQLHALARQRRSVRWFIDKQVDREMVDQALIIARESPSACNRLPYEFRIFDEPDLCKEISNMPFGTGGYADNIPMIAVLVGKLESYFSARDRHAIYIDTSLAAMSFALALETLGLSSCMINWPDFEPLEHKIAKRLNLAKHERPIMLMAIGHADPAAMVPNSKKKDLSTIRSYNRLR